MLRKKLTINKIADITEIFGKINNRDNKCHKTSITSLKDNTFPKIGKIILRYLEIVQNENAKQL